MKFNRKILSMLIMLSIFFTSGCNNANYSSSQSGISYDIQQFEGYASVVEEYKEFVNYITNNKPTGYINDEIFSLPDEKFSYEWGCMKAEMISWYYHTDNVSQKSFGYALKDLNGNGSPELILLTDDYSVRTVYSMVNGEPKLLGAFWPRGRCTIGSDGILYTHGSGGATYWSDISYQISQDDNELIEVNEFGMDGDYYYKLVDGNEVNISELELKELINGFPDDTQVTKESGVTYVPVINE